jgi:23S rRNA (cytosine1962-C5)-methyltransferase
LLSIDNLTNKINSAINYRKKFFADNNTTAFRIFNGIGDGIHGITIDYFDNYYLITWFNVDIYKQKTKIIDILKSITKYKGIYQKKRFAKNEIDPDNSYDFICGIEAPTPLIVKENSVNFAIYLDDGAMVGIFLDQKDVRKTIKEKYSNGKTMLNTFSYTGAFSIYAALGGATKTTSVDLANRSLYKTQEQFKINNIDPDTQNIIVQDVFSYFKYAVKKNITYDLVVLDPPSFARSKKMIFTVAKDYTNLLKEAIQITNRGGVIVASTNYAGLNMMRFRDFVKKAFKELNLKYEILESFSLPSDFKISQQFSDSNYLKVLFIKRF